MVRNRVKRRLRAIAAEILPTLPQGTGLVVRALPDAAQVTFSRLRGDVVDAVRRASAKVAA